MTRNARVDENSDFQQIALPLDLTVGEHILQRTRFEADGETGSWYELYLVVIPHGFLIEKHSGSSRGHGRVKKTWSRRFLPDAKRKYSQILSYQLSHTRHNRGECKGSHNEFEAQQKLFG